MYTSFASSCMCFIKMLFETDSNDLKLKYLCFDFDEH